MPPAKELAEYTCVLCLVIPCLAVALRFAYHVLKGTFDYG